MKRRIKALYPPKHGTPPACGLPSGVQSFQDGKVYRIEYEDGLIRVTTFKAQGYNTAGELTPSPPPSVREFSCEGWVWEPMDEPAEPKKMKVA